jgi:glycosyltransferase involved in cell wall biosynthesis
MLRIVVTGNGGDMRFALVVPALNEEDAIAGTLRRCLAAREKVVARTPVDEMVVVFVNDGSTDHTQEVVDQPEFVEVVKVRFEKNRGYGAAIKAGYRATDAEFVGFIDGDGTCNPDFCVDLLTALFENQADVVLAARLSPESEMPFIRKLGNTIFAKLLSFVSGNKLTDSASGFRIIRRSSLKLLTPLPDGLHYTPTMSTIAMLDPRLRIEEVHGMKYAEREGRSKLSVFRDGFRFLFTILFTVCCYSPIKTALVFSVFVAVGFGVVALLSTAEGIGNVFVIAGGLVISVFLMAGVVVHQLNRILIGPRHTVTGLESALLGLLHYGRLLWGGAIIFALGALGLLMGRNISDWIGSVSIMISTGLCYLGALAAVGGIVQRVIWAIGEKRQALVRDEYEIQGQGDAGTPTEESCV